MSSNYIIKPFFDVTVPCLSETIEGSSLDETLLKISLSEQIGQNNIVLGKEVMFRPDPTGVVFLARGTPFAGHVPRPIPALLWGDLDLYQRLMQDVPITIDTFSPNVLHTLLEHGILEISNETGKRRTEISSVFAQYSNLPIKSVLEVTAACQCDCDVTCYLRDTLDGYMPKTKTLLRRIGHLATLGIPIIEISGGEATLRQLGKNADLSVLFERIEEFGLLHYMVSNGELLADPQVFSSLLPYLKRGGVAVSIDGVNEVHDQMRGRDGLFEKLKLALENLRQENVPRIISATIGPYNVEQLEKILQFGIEHDIPIYVRPVADTGNASNRGNVTTNMSLWDNVKSVISSNKEYGRYVLNAFITPNSPVETVHTYGCNAGHKGIRITPKGELHLCYLDVAEPQGNILSFNQEKLSKRIAEFTKQKLSNYIPCSSCEVAAYRQADPQNPGPGACYGPCQYSGIAGKGDWTIRFPEQVVKR